MGSENEILTTKGETGLVAAGAVITKTENEMQMTFALQNPRNEKQIFEKCMMELDLYPSLAEIAIYRKPVGKDDSGNMQYAENLSVRTAESLAARWCNSRTKVSIIGEDENCVTIEAAFIDMETNIGHVLTSKVYKTYKAKGGNIVARSPAMMELSVLAAQSKLKRNVILESLPAGLKEEYKRKAYEIRKQSIDPAKMASIVAGMVAGFAKYKISRDELIALAGKSLETLDKDDVLNLQGIFNSLKDGDTTKEALFENTVAGKTASAADALKAKVEEQKKDKGNKESGTPELEIK